METGYTNSVRKVRNALHFKGGFNMELAKVTSKGQVKALKAGKGKTVTITASALDGSGKKARFKIKLK